MCQLNGEPSLLTSKTKYRVSVIGVLVADHHRPNVFMIIDVDIYNGLDHVHLRGCKHRRYNSLKTRRTHFSRKKLPTVYRLPLIMKTPKFKGRTDGTLCLTRPSLTRIRKESSRCKTVNVKNVDKE